jgi:hypothetical protein
MLEWLEASGCVWMDQILQLDFEEMLIDALQECSPQTSRIRTQSNGSRSAAAVANLIFQYFSLLGDFTVPQFKARHLQQ